METLFRLKRTFSPLLLLLIVGSSITIHAQEAWKLMNNDARGEMTCVSDSLIYTFAGGRVDWKIGNETWSYNTNTNSWVQLENMPMAMTEGGIGQIGDKIYLVDGWRNESESNDDWITVDSILEYDMATDTFTFRKKTPLKIGSSISCMMNDEMYLFGGIGSIDPEVLYANNARIYDPVNEQWDMASVPDMQYPHLMHGTAEVLDGNIYVLGGTGIPPDFTSQRSEKYDGEKWEPIAEMPVPVVLHTSVVHDNKILLFGGDDFWSPSTSNSTNLIQEYDPSTDSWRLMEPMPFQRSSMGGGKVGNSVYLSSGYQNDREPDTKVSEVWQFNLDSLQEWCTKVSITEPSENFKPGDEVTLYADVLPSDFANKAIIWSSDNDSVVTVQDSMNGTFNCVSVGTATITATLKYGGCSDSYNLDVITGIKENKEKYLSVYPNPTNNLITIETVISDLYNIDITSLNGQLILSKEMEGTSHQFDLSSFREGVYFITIMSKNFVTTRKIVKL